MNLSSSPSMRVSFHGVRGSHSVCGARYLKFGGCTASVSIEAAGWRILLDLGTGLSGQGKIWTNGASNGVPPARPLAGVPAAGDKPMEMDDPVSIDNPPDGG